ncbi:MAG: hypothetical protein ACO3AG_00715 [Fluviibacter sp.]
MSNWSNLKVELMDAGSNDTTWGNVTNANLGTVLEEAIVKTANITFSGGNQILTLTDTTGTQPARNMRLNLSGDGGYYLYLGDGANIQKPYIIKNGTTGIVTVRNYNGSIGTGASLAIPAGATMWVYNDGTDIVDVVSHITSLTLGTALPITQGGTGQNTAANARAALSAAALGANSDITSITGLTTALAINQGGTGATTAPTARSNISAAASGANTDITSLNPTGGLQVGAPTGGAKGDGTVNATGLFINGVAVGTGSGSVTSVNATTSIGGLTITGGPITTSGTLTLALSSASSFRSAVSAAASGANTDITSLNQSTSVNASGTIAADSIGYRGMPQSSNTTLALSDAGKHIYTASNITIPPNSGTGSVAFPTGTAIVIVNSGSGTPTISITTDTLRQTGTSNVGTRTLAAYGMATLIKVAATTWYISGNVS